MNSVRKLCSLAIVLSASLAAAQPVRFDDVVDQLDRVSIRARRAGGTCRSPVSERIVELADRLDEQRVRPRGLSRVMDDLSDLHALASYQGCPDAVLDGILVTMDLVSDTRATNYSPERRNDDDDFAVAKLSALQASLDDQSVKISVPSLTLRGIKGQAFNLVFRVRSADGPWSELERTQKWSVPADPFVWQNAWTFTVLRSKLTTLDTARGRFIARVSVADDKGRELGYREVRFAITSAPQPTQLVAVDCGAGPELGCSMTRNGLVAIDRQTFQTSLAIVTAEKNDKKRLKLALTAFATSALTAAQLAVLLDQLPDDKARFDAASAFMNRVINPADAVAYGTRFKSLDVRAKYASLVQLQLNPNAQPRSWRVKGEMDRRAFTFEAKTQDEIRGKCKAWKEGDISTQGFIMRLAIDGGRVRSDMLNTAEACDAVTAAATPLY